MMKGVKIVPFFIQAGGTLNKAAFMVLEPILLPVQTRCKAMMNRAGISPWEQVKISPLKVRKTRRAQKTTRKALQ